MSLPDKRADANAPDNVVATDRFDRMQAELTARSRQQSAVAELGQAALSQIDGATLIGQACGLVVDVLRVDFCRVLEHLPDEGSLVCRAFVGRGRDEQAGGVDDEALHAFAANAPVVFGDLTRETRFSGEPSLRRLGVTSGASVTLAGLASPFGVLGAYSVAPREFREYEVEFLQCIANVLAAAIESRRVHAALRETRAMVALAEHSGAAGSAADPALALQCDALIVVVDEDGYLARANDHAMLALRCEPGEVAGMSLAGTPAGEPWKTLRRLAAVVAETELATSAAAEEDGTYWELYASGLARTGPGHVRVLVVVHDVTTRARREDIRFRTDLVDAATSMLSGIVRRASEPVATLTELLGRDYREVALTEESLRKGRSALFTLTSLVRDLEDYSAPFSLDRAPSSPQHAMEEAILAVVSGATRRRIQIDTDFVSRAEILLNHSRLVALFRDVLSTFVERVRDGSTISISILETIARGRSLVTIGVATAEPIFEEREVATAFGETLPNARHDRGIRFAVDRRIADEHGGAIRVASGERGGTLVEMSFPMYRAFTPPAG